MVVIGLSMLASAKAVVLLEKSPATTGAAVLSSNLNKNIVSRIFTVDFSFTNTVSLVPLMFEAIALLRGKRVCC